MVLFKVKDSDIIEMSCSNGQLRSGKGITMSCSNGQLRSGKGVVVSSIENESSMDKEVSISKPKVLVKTYRKVA